MVTSLVPALAPDRLTELHVLNNGVELGLLKKKRFETKPSTS